MDIAIKINKLDGLERSVTITVPRQDYKSTFNKNLLKFQSKAKHHGFRSGKVPEKIILSKYKNQIHDEAVNNLVETSLQKALSENDLQTASPPQLSIEKQPSFDNDFVFTAKFEIFPTFNLIDLSNIIIEEFDVEINEKDIDNVIENIQKQHTKWEKTTKKANSGDKIIIDYVGLVDKKEFNGSKQNDFTFILDEKMKGDQATTELYNEFFKAVNNECAGNKKSFIFNFPKEFPDKNIAGKEAEYKISIKTVYRGVLPSLDKKFYQKFGLKDCDDAKFRENILEHMKHELKEKIDSHKTANINHQLVEKNNFDIPKHMIEANKQSLTAQYKGMMKEIDDVTKIELEKIAIKRAKLNLIYMKISEEHKIKITNEDVYSFISKKYPDQYDIFSEKIKKDEKYLNQLKNQVLEDGIIKFIRDKCKVTKVKKDFSEVMN